MHNAHARHLRHGLGKRLRQNAQEVASAEVGIATDAVNSAHRAERAKVNSATTDSVRHTSTHGLRDHAYDATSKRTFAHILRPFANILGRLECVVARKAKSATSHAASKRIGDATHGKVGRPANGDERRGHTEPLPGEVESTLHVAGRLRNVQHLAVDVASRDAAKRSRRHLLGRGRSRLRPQQRLGRIQHCGGHDLLCLEPHVGNAKAQFLEPRHTGRRGRDFLDPARFAQILLYVWRPLNALPLKLVLRLVNRILQRHYFLPFAAAARDSSTPPLSDFTKFTRLTP